MDLKVRRFTKETLKKYDNVIQNPLVAISPENQKTLGVKSGKIKVGDFSARLISGKSDKFIGMTKTLRENLGVEIDQTVNVEYKDQILTIN